MEVAVSVEAQLSVEGIAPAAPFLSSVEGAVLVEGPLFTIISTHRDCVERSWDANLAKCRTYEKTQFPSSM